MRAPLVYFNVHAEWTKKNRFGPSEFSVYSTVMMAFVLPYIKVKVNRLLLMCYVRGVVNAHAYGVDDHYHTKGPRSYKRKRGSLGSNVTCMT